MLRSAWRHRILFCIAILLIAIVSDAQGRAGGGGNFRGGGGGGYSGGGGGGFGGGSGGIYIGGGGVSGGWTMAIVVIVIVIVVLSVLARAADSQSKASTIRRGFAVLDRNLSREGIALLRSKDPQFDPAHFANRVADAFKQIQHAWSAQDLVPVRSFLSDGVYERFQLQVREQQEMGFRDHVENVRVHDVTVAQVVDGEVFETVSVRVFAQAVDYEEWLDGRGYRGGSRASEQFTEFWTFIRRHGAQTLQTAGLIEGNCPNCGRDIRMSQHALCESCGAILRSGRHDWVLCEITQESEWKPRAQEAVPGFESLRAKDPELSLDELEDRASVMFWRRADAERLRDVRPMRKVALPAYADARAQAYRKTSNEDRLQWFGDIGVGSVDTVGILRGHDYDRALVVVAWSGTRYRIYNGQMAAMGETSVIRTLLVLARKPDVRSNADKGISSAHCPNCGAPESNTAANACESCGTVLNDGSAGWVLENALSAIDLEARSLIASARQADEAVLQRTGAPGAGQSHPPALPSLKGLLSWVIAMSAADGEIVPREREMIQQLAGRAGVSADETLQLIAAAQAGHLEVAEPRNRDESMAWLGTMATAAMLDGQLSSEEKRLLIATGGRLGFSEADIKLLLKRQRKHLYTDARAALRAERGV